MAEAALTSGDERNQAWADINKMIVEQAPGIPYVWDDSYQLQSKDMNARDERLHDDVGPVLHVRQVARS